MSSQSRPIVLSISGHDPTGGAGIQADIEAIHANGCQPVTLVSCLTTQDSHNVRSLFPQDPNRLLEQLDCLLADLPVAAIKIGLLGSAQIAECLAQRLRRLSLPLVLDPVLAAGGGTPLAGRELCKTIVCSLLPVITLATPNAREARLLSGKWEMEQAARTLLSSGCRNVLITGADEQTEEVTNWLYREGERPLEHRWPRLPHSYHGSGCTLASACCAQLAQGLKVDEAILRAQQYTWNCLQQGFQPSRGQWFPRRLRTGPGAETGA